MNKVNWGYCSHSWNPLAMRCTRVSEGCEHCWHLRMADRLAKNPKIPSEEREVYAGSGGWCIIRDVEMDAPSRRKKPAIVAVQLMGDLGHETVADEDRGRVWIAMTKAPQHTFLVLTKRPKRIAHWMHHHWTNMIEPNIFLGVTVENQQAANERIPTLLKIPAAGHWLSIEPMLGPVDLYPAFCGFQPPSWGCGPDISGVALGGESGPGARPMHPDWARGVRDQCADSGVPFHFKSWGKWIPSFEMPDGTMVHQNFEKHKQRLLDGREHNETAWGMPA